MEGGHVQGIYLQRTPLLLGGDDKEYEAKHCIVNFGINDEGIKEGVLYDGNLKSAIDLLAGIPSVIYGFWGLYVLVPLMRNIQLYL
jgi:hypothetical protein